MMSIDAINALSTAAGPAETQAARTLPRSDFSAAIDRGVHTVDVTLKNADQLVRAMAAGQDVATHDVMMSL
ncbi:flagellar hook-basal body complex protein FliE, partial [Tritonibacter sp. SIMBA_163]|uniref:flagellar hook-basal body complex protein FliE n=1 Tax=Tritonibacter sp. SIMBA_163 TaxID=3080868 RepID=UPI003981412D